MTAVQSCLHICRTCSFPNTFITRALHKPSDSPRHRSPFVGETQSVSDLFRITFLKTAVVQTAGVASSLLHWILTLRVTETLWHSCLPVCDLQRMKQITLPSSRPPESTHVQTSETLFDLDHSMKPPLLALTQQHTCKASPL